MTLALHAGLLAGAVASPAAVLAQHPAGNRSVTVPIGLPRGDVFDRLVADPKEPEFLLSYLWVRSEMRSSAVGAVGLGENFGLIRWPGSAPGEGLQLGLVGGIFAQFDLRTRSHDLLNADYVVGIPVTYRRSIFSGRLRLYHQSSHLGDEFLLETQPQPERVNLSFESAELMGAVQLGALRVYAGGELIFRREPADLQPGIVHAGLEYRQRAPLFHAGIFGSAHLMVAVDVRSWQQQHWRPGWSLRGGLALASAQPESGIGERLGLLIHLYDGPSPYGQFYLVEVSSVGLGAHFRL